MNDVSLNIRLRLLARAAAASSSAREPQHTRLVRKYLIASWGVNFQFPGPRLTRSVTSSQSSNSPYESRSSTIISATAFISLTWLHSADESRGKLGIDSRIAC